MARIAPVKEAEWSPAMQQAFQQHQERYKVRINNMKATLGSSLLVFDTYMQWYPLYEEVKIILGERLAYLFAYAVSSPCKCSVSAVFFRKVIVDAGECPENLSLTEHEQEVVNFGAAISMHQGNISDGTYNFVAKKYTSRQMLILVAFAGQVIATNILNNVIETDIDEYLTGYVPPVKSCW